MKPISVIIPTANRPKFLEETLSSVARQTALNEIEEVIVSENGGNIESRAVCAQFKSLPIRYIFQDPPVSLLEHAACITKLARAEFIALLHDDDWWAQEHLEAALKTLKSHPDCAATYSNHYSSTDPSAPYTLSNHMWPVWVISGCSFADHVLTLDEVDTMFSCLAWTDGASLHYSTLVGRLDAMKEAFSKNYATGNYFDNDRQFPVFLSLHGKICYLTMPSVFIREHSQRNAREYLHISDKLIAQTTRWLMESFPSNAAKAKELFNTIASELNPDRLRHLSNVINMQARKVLIQEYGFNLVPVPIIKRLLRQICPPVLWNMASKAKSMYQQSTLG